MLNNIKHSNISKELDILTDFHANGSYEEIAKHFRLLDEKNYAYMVRTTDLEHENYEYDVKYVTKECYDYLNKSKVYGGEVLINKIGSPGLTYLMPCLNKPVSLGMNLFMLRMKENSGINNATLYLYLNSKIGKSLITRNINGTVPLTIDKESIRNVLVPVFTQNFQNLLSHVLKMREDFLKNANNLFKQAEDILNRELGITNIENTRNYSVKSFSESFCKSKRLDAEYYQDKYDYFFKQIKSYKNGRNSVETYFDYVKTKCARNHSSYLYIEIGDVNIGNGDAYPNLIQTDELPDNAKTMTKIGDILVSTVRPNRGAITVIDSEGILVSGAFTVLRNKNCGYLSETLQVLFRTEVYRNWFLKFNVGTSYPVIKDKDVLNMKVPIISKDIQMIISDKVKKSCKLRKQSKDLLDKAVKAVELAIEKNEEYASQWLIENTNEIYHKDKY